MIRRLFRVSVAMAVLCGLGNVTATHASTLWYKGDPNGGGAYSNNVPLPLEPRALIFEDFVVPEDSSWHVSDIWSNNILSFGSGLGEFLNTNQANWSIRTNMSEQSEGTVLFGGTDAASYMTNGYWGPDTTYPVYKVLVSGLSIDLAPGHYWLQVSPVAPEPNPTSPTDMSLVTTLGTNSVGQVPGVDESPLWGPNGLPGSSEYFRRLSPSNRFSMGIAGTTTAIPEPSTVSLLAVSVASGLAFVRRKRPSGLNADL